jgi:hypothetical protein
VTGPADDESRPAAGLPVTLRDLLAAPDLQLACASGEDRLDRPVRWSHTTELLDPAPYLRGGELVCTIGTSLTTAEACTRFTASAVGANVAGICFGVGDVHDQVPPALVSACARHGLPLVVAPLGVPFMAISEHLAQRRVEAESATGERGSHLLAELLAHVRRHASTQDLMDLAVATLGGSLDLREGERPIHRSVGPGDASDEQEVSATTDEVTLTWRGTGARPSASLLASLVRVLDVARHERDVEQDLRRERTGQLLSLVGDRLADPAVLDFVIRDSGLPATGLVFSVWPAGAARVLASAFAAPVALGETPSATVAVSGSDAEVRSVALALGVVCGLSRTVAPGESARGISEARAAFELARARGGCVGPEGLTSLEGLLAQQPPERLQPFVDQLLEPLLGSDRRRRTDYVTTLGTFLERDGSLTATARAHFLHVNTVRHRLERIKDLTGRDPLVFNDRVAFAIALWSHRSATGRTE